jgi:hypothetical protein
VSEQVTEEAAAAMERGMLVRRESVELYNSLNPDLVTMCTAVPRWKASARFAKSGRSM